MALRVVLDFMEVKESKATRVQEAFKVPLAILEVKDLLGLKDNQANQEYQVLRASKENRENLVTLANQAGLVTLDHP